MTGPFARAVAVALVGIALGSLPGAVSGAPQDSDEIPVVVKPWVKKYVNQDVLKSLRSRLHDLIGEDEIGKASIEITYRGDGLHVVAVTTLPTLKGREYSVRRFLLLTTAGWDRMPGAEPIKTKTGDYEWKVSRAERPSHGQGEGDPRQAQGATRTQAQTTAGTLVRRDPKL